MSETTLTRRVTLVTDECCVCGVLHAIPQHMLSHARKKGGWWYCPNGHHIGWNPQDSESETDRLRAEVARLQSSVAFERERAEAEKRKAAAAKASVERVTARVGNGVCPCCNRTFKQLQRHMRSKHPDFPAA